ncbi:MAG: PKD domain-containing protein [Chitinophagales bacterium]
MRLFIFTLVAFLSIHVSGAINAGFSASSLNGCPPLLINFNSAPGINATCVWNFGNGNTSNLTNPSAMFTNPGIYTVKLVVTDGSHVDSSLQTITVYELPVFNFNAADVTVCYDDTLKLFSHVVSSSAPITDYAWDFGDGISSSGSNTIHRYAIAGNYDVSLIVQDAHSCIKSLTKPAYVRALPKPVASFFASPPFSCSATETIVFTNQSTGSGLTYKWLLDDSTYSQAANPIYTYQQEVDVVKLMITDNQGCRDTALKTIRVVDVNASFTADEEDICTGLPIQFTNNSNFHQSSRWDFGDGTTSSAHHATKIYSAPGIYTVKLVNSYYGCSDSLTKVAYITANICVSAGGGGGGGCKDSTVFQMNSNLVNGNHLSWDFGDGATSIMENPLHTYYSDGDYTVIHYYHNSSGQLVADSTTVTVSNTRPVPIFNLDTANCTNGNLVFRSLSTNAVAQVWNFGDGDTSSLKIAHHIYTSPGVYHVSLTVWNANGCDSTITKSIVIKNLETEIFVDKTFSPCPPFVALFTSNTNRPNVTYQWGFGDGGTHSAATPTHVYFYPGVYEVVVISRTGNGCIDTTWLPAPIQVQGPEGQFDLSQPTGCVPHTVTFSTEVSSNTRHIWADLGDGTLVTDSQLFTHTYTYPDSFHPKFILVDSVGCSVPYTLPVVQAVVPPVMHMTDTVVCAGSDIHLAFDSGLYKWSPATYLSCDTCAELTITPATSLSYEISSANEFCVIYYQMDVEVLPLPESGASQEIKTCRGSSVVLHTASADSFSWSPALYLSDSSISSPICTPAQDIMYQVEAYNQLGCFVTDTVYVKILDKLEIAVSDDIVVCANDTFALYASVLTAPDSLVTYHWTPSLYLATDNTPLVSGQNLPSTTTFTVTAQSGACGTDTKSVTVQVKNNPVIPPFHPVTVYIGEPAVLSVTGQGNYTYQWQAADSLSCNDCQSATIFPTKSQVVYVTITQPEGCSTTDSLFVSVAGCNPDVIFAPNVFSPNGDGLNDVFATSHKALSRFDYMRIFNRWGQVVFETTDGNQSWDGTANGTIAFDEVYVYVLQGQCYDGEELIKSGSITLVR